MSSPHDASDPPLQDSRPDTAGFAWPASPLPLDEDERLARLLDYDILDQPVDPAFARIVRLAAERLQVPMCTVSLIDTDRQWFLAPCGLDATETPREQAFCAHTILADTLFVVEDARLDARFAANPLVTGAPHIRFYAGAPLLTREGLRLGALCALDTEPRVLDDAALRALRDYAAMVVDALDLRQALARREDELVVARTARQDAEAASRAKDAFLATMSHELRTPLNGVTGAAGLLARTTLDDRQRRLVDLMNQSAVLLRTVIDDVLDYSKLEAGGLVPERQPFDAGQLLVDTCEMLRPVAAGKALALNLDLDPGLLDAQRLGDATRLRQVLLNLLNNAIKFTERGGVTVRARALDARTVSFEVRDTGIGMDAAVRERLFEPFRQADASITRRFGGTGLGLAICHRLVQAMGGGIVADSRPGAGSVFRVELPLPPA